MKKPGRKPGQAYPKAPTSREPTDRLLATMRELGHVPADTKHPLAEFEPGRLRDAIAAVMGEDDIQSFFKLATARMADEDGNPIDVEELKSSTIRRYLSDSRTVVVQRLAQIATVAAYLVGYEHIGPLAKDAEGVGLDEYLLTEPEKLGTQVSHAAALWAYRTFVAYLVGGKTPDTIKAQRYVIALGIMELEPWGLELVGNLVAKLLDASRHGDAFWGAWGAMAPGPRNVASPYPSRAETVEALRYMASDHNSLTALEKWARHMASLYKEPDEDPEDEAPF